MQQLLSEEGNSGGEFTFLFLQAFLEMGTEEAAITMVNYYTTVTPHIRNVPVFIQYSNHKELKTDAGNQVSRAVELNVSVSSCNGD